MTPSFEAGVKHVEFVQLASDQALAVLVYDDGRVENRLMALTPGMTLSVLHQASNYLNARLRGRTLTEARRELKTELDVERQKLDEAATQLIEAGLAAWSGGDTDKRALIVRGQANLLEASALDDLERIRALFEDLEQNGRADRPAGRRHRGPRRANFHRRGVETVFFVRARRL